MGLQASLVYIPFKREWPNTPPGELGKKQIFGDK